MDRHCSTAIPPSEDSFVVEAELIAEKPDLPLDILRQEIKRGIVYGVVEQGDGEDAGRPRLTFYRARSGAVTLEDINP